MEPSSILGLAAHFRIPHSNQALKSGVVGQLACQDASFCLGFDLPGANLDFALKVMFAFFFASGAGFVVDFFVAFAVPAFGFREDDLVARLVADFFIAESYAEMHVRQWSYLDEKWIQTQVKKSRNHNVLAIWQSLCPLKIFPALVQYWRTLTLAALGATVG